MSEGHAILLDELYSQLPGGTADLIVCPASASALTQAAINHIKASAKANCAIMAVEADTAASLWKSLSREEPVESKINGQALFEASWSSLKPGIDACATVSDYEAHLASIDLKSSGVIAGRAGASGLAAIGRLEKSQKSQLGLNEDSVVVVISTGAELVPCKTPRDVSSDDVISLTQTLVNIDSSNPDFGSIPGPGETEIANYVMAWMEHRDIENHRIEPSKGRPSIVGIVRGTGGGKSLMFNGHLDTVTLLGYNGDALSGHIADGNMYGRGTADMKSGLAAEMLALASAKSKNLRGDVILAAVADEESESVGTEQVIKAGWRADAAIVAEPTEMALINTHKGFALFEVDIHGVSCHGSRADLGVDAICKAGHFLVELDHHAQELQNRFGNDKPETGAPNIHAGVIKGGEEIASYPAKCTISIERRTISGENADTVRAELLAILDKLAATVPDFRFDLRSTFSRAPYFIPRDHDFVQMVSKHATNATGAKPIIKGETYWTDMALLDEVGIPGLIWGPKGYGLHAKTEWVEVESVKQLATAFVDIVADFCK
jgi:acetylornithine deacetylase/succinyl-diaminopimelate desuccinylase family protein